VLGDYDALLVILSVVVAIVASHVALDLTSRIKASHGRKASQYWLIGGAVSMGIGIWSMHFIGMLAWRLPIPVWYDVTMTSVSLLVAMASSAFALYLASRDTLGVRRLLAGSAVMGIGIATMHYTGMAAMQMHPPIGYEPLLFGLSILVAVAASAVALWSSFKLRMETILSAFWKKTGSALVMGAAICGMHYTGLAAAVIAPGSVGTVSPLNIDNIWLAGTLGAFTLLFLTATLLLSAFDAYLADKLQRLNVDLEKYGTDLSCTNALLTQEAQLRAQAEEILRQAHAELDARVVERTAELVRANESLRRSEEQRQQALEERAPVPGPARQHRASHLRVGMRVEECQRLVRGNPNEVTAQLAQVVGGLNSVIRDVRQYIAGPSRQIPDGRQLRAQLVELVAAIDSADASRFQLDVDDAAIERLTLDEVEQVLSIAREALSNCLRHSHARHGTISLRLAGGGVRLEVSDDGVGFDPRQPRQEDGGLENIEARARQIGARLEIQSAPGQGVHLIVHIAREKNTHGEIGRMPPGVVRSAPVKRP
jgi:NO-binding membrane sensor protein with MHYT domain/two-component sensor histidine kinase